MSYPSHAAPPSNRPRPARSTIALVLIAALLLIAGCGTGAQPPTGAAPSAFPEPFDALGHVLILSTSHAYARITSILA